MEPKMLVWDNTCMHPMSAQQHQSSCNPAGTQKQGWGQGSTFKATCSRTAKCHVFKKDPQRINLWTCPSSEQAGFGAGPSDAIHLVEAPPARALPCRSKKGRRST